MNEAPRVSEAEWEVMKVVWASAPLAASDIILKLTKTFSWSPKTIRTLISRLIQKGVLGYSEKGKYYEYFPIVDEEECMKQERQNFLKRIYGGALKPMLVQFLQDDNLTSSDIEDLRRLLEQKEKNKGTEET
ncbi:BlaI/MecI/CopY family transcriptional regulator [Paenibacillus albiflavus]|uniref:BlaI/MecI/CopY family transcriptional regulator n=1 Tax=Paenibacillus albiflavus TaxID=2545760 RepID=A0A4R4ER34_9BACL|nr:BlaI/MecI/CopY family transcriptional regulator [Paenibacillus albiflavus]TCZ81101.1 BlaI/MecI/CopY family transcriptional regulator [Paenibacillus albiflavus]